MFKKCFLSMLILSVAVGPIGAAVDLGTPRLGQVGLQFLSIGQSARAAGMGYAFTAVADDINTVFWNPGGLTRIENFEYTFTYTRWFVNSNLYSAAVARRTDFGAFALSMISFVPESFEETTVFAAQGTGRIMKPGSMAIGLAYAHQLTDKFAFGVTFRYIQEDLVLNKSHSYDVNIGSTFQTGFRSTRFSMSLRNLGPDVRMDTNRYRLPLDFTLGSAMEVYGDIGDPLYATLALDYLYNIEREDRYHMGAEVWISNMLALRSGYRWKYYMDKGFTAGFGVKYPFSDGKDIRIDFAYTQSGRLFESPLRLTVSGAF